MYDDETRYEAIIAYLNDEITERELLKYYEKTGGSDDG